MEFVNCLVDFAFFDRVSLKQVTFRGRQMRDADFTGTMPDRWNDILDNAELFANELRIGIAAAGEDDD